MADSTDDLVADLKAKAEKAGFKTRSLINVAAVVYGLEGRAGTLQALLSELAATLDDGLTAAENPNGYTREQLEVIAAREAAVALHSTAGWLEAMAELLAAMVRLEADQYRPRR